MSIKVSGKPAAEGVWYRMGDACACAVRNEERDITVRAFQQPRFFRNLLSHIPFLRGIARMFGACGDFATALRTSARMNPQSGMRGGAKLRRFAKLHRTTAQSVAAAAEGVAAPLLLIALTLLMPMLAGRLLGRIPGVMRITVNLLSCLLRVLGCVLALFLIGRMRVVRRLLMYRGAAVKVKNVYLKHGPDVTHEQALLCPRFSNTSDGVFLLITLMAALVGVTFIRTGPFWLQVLLRLGVLLLSAAVTNECIRPLERAREGSFRALLRRPMLGMQRLFTIEPHNQMVEVALCAIRAAWANDLT